MRLKPIYHLIHAAGALRRKAGLAVATRYHHATLGAVGAGARFQWGAAFHPAGRITIGRDCYVWRGVTASTECASGFLRIGDRVSLNRDVHLDMTGGLEMGCDVMISEEAVIYTHDHGLNPRAKPAICPKSIGDGVWIGMRAVILPGCRRIGAGAVIGAGAILTKDVPAGAIMAGNPARMIAKKPSVQEVA